MASVLDQLGGGFAGSIPTTMYYLGWILLATVILGVIAAIYFFMDYKYKVTILERRGGSLNSFYIGKIKNTRAKYEKDKKDGLFKYSLMFKNIKLNNIKDKHILANNRIFLLKVSDTLYLPMGINKTEEGADFEPIDQDTKAWAMNEIKQAAIDYQAKSAFEQYGQYMAMVGTILFCLVLTGLTVYFTFKYAGGGVDAMNGLSNSLNNFGNTIGAPVA